jgi:hypothetical protein
MTENHIEFKAFYKSIGKLYCPYFKDFIHFTDTGFNHLQFKNKHTLRSLKDRDMRMKHLPLAIKLIGQSHTLQNKAYRNRFEERHVNARREIALLSVIYYEFIAVIEEKRLKVVVKQVENREKTFLSIVPLFQQKMPPEESDML